MLQLLRWGLLLFSVLFLQNVQALTFVSTGVTHEQLVKRLLQNSIQPHLASLPASQQQRLSQVKVSVSQQIRLSGMALSLAEEEPLILINGDYFQGLDHYVEAYLIGQVSAKPHLLEQYMNYYFWHTHPVFDGPLLKAPLEWSGFTPEDPAAFASLKDQVLNSAVLDLLLHEMGHHAEDAFYHYRASQYMKQEKEREADRWAEQFRLAYLPDQNELGRLLSIGFIFERDRWSRLSQDEYHPRLLEWVMDNAYTICEDVIQLETQRYCSQLSYNVDTYLSTEKAEVAYRERVAEGEVYASFPLALILLQQGNPVAACNYFNDSMQRANVSRAAFYLGHCYAEGYLKPVPPDSRVLAMAAYRNAIAYGYSDAKQEMYELR